MLLFWDKFGTIVFVRGPRYTLTHVLPFVFWIDWENKIPSVLDSFLNLLLRDFCVAGVFHKFALAFLASVWYRECKVMYRKMKANVGGKERQRTKEEEGKDVLHFSKRTGAGVTAAASFRLALHYSIPLSFFLLFSAEPVSLRVTRACRKSWTKKTLVLCLENEKKA